MRQDPRLPGRRFGIFGKAPRELRGALVWKLDVLVGEPDDAAIQSIVRIKSTLHVRQDRTVDQDCRTVTVNLRRNNLV